MTDPEPTSKEAEVKTPETGAKPEATKEAETKVTEPKGAEGTPKEAPQKDDLNTIMERERARYSGLDRKLSETVRQSQERETALQKQLDEALSKAFDAENQRYLRTVEEAGGDVNTAKAILEREAKSRQLEADTRRKATELARREEELGKAAKAKLANDLVQELKLKADDLSTLLEADTPEAMEAKALRIERERRLAAEKPTTTVKAPVRTNKSQDISKIPDSLRLAQLMQERAEEGR